MYKAASQLMDQKHSNTDLQQYFSIGLWSIEEIKCRYLQCKFCLTKICRRNGFNCLR